MTNLTRIEDQSSHAQVAIGIADQLLPQAGITPEQALRAATGVAADCLGLDDVGTIQAGRRADFIVLDADPLKDITNSQMISQVYVAGQPMRE